MVLMIEATGDETFVTRQGITMRIKDMFEGLVPCDVETKYRPELKGGLARGIDGHLRQV